MKKIFVLLLVVSFSMTQLYAQESTFNMGDKVLNIGLGLGSTLYSGTYYKSQVPPLSVSMEVAVVENILEKGVIGVGGYLGYSSYKYEYSGYGWKYSNIILGPRGSFHYPLVDKLDTYTGLLIGYNISTTKEIGNIPFGFDSSSAGGVVWSWFVGGRYYFKETFGVMAEFGYGISYLTIGVATKF